MKKVGILKNSFETFELNGEVKITKTMLITLSILIFSILFLITSNNNVFQIVSKLIKLFFDI